MSDLSKRETAQELGVSEKTVERWIAEGRLEAYRIGPRLVRVKRASLQSLQQPIHPNYSDGLGVR